MQEATYQRKTLQLFNYSSSSSLSIRIILHQTHPTMPKLASAREARLYGPWLTRNRFEYINASLYLFAAILLICGFAAQLSHMSAKSGLIVLTISLILIMVVNFHDLFAHMAGIDYRFPLLGLDLQLGFVEFAVPVVHALGCLFLFLGVLFVFIQSERGYSHYKMEMSSSNMLIAGSLLLLLGAIHNACQIYERANGLVQILQQSVHLPFLMGSLLLVVGTIINKNERNPYSNHSTHLLGKSLVVLGIIAGLLFFIGGIMNLVKVFKMQQMDGIRLEKLRNGAQEQLHRDREDQVPLILEEQRRRKRQVDEARMEAGAPVPMPMPPPAPVLGPGAIPGSAISAPYKDAGTGN